MVPNLPEDIARRVARPLRLTWAGLVAERLVQAFWPLVTVSMALAALILSGVAALWAPALMRLLIAGLGLAAVLTFLYGLRRLTWPAGAEALARLDRSLPGRPLAALADRQALGRGDPGSQSLWAAHLERVAAGLARVRPTGPDAGLPRRDPFALRLSAATALAMALLFGAGTDRAALTALVPTTAAGGVAEASWEGWIEPPAYTGKPVLYLADQPPGALTVPTGARVTLRLYGRLGALDITESFTGASPPEPEPTRIFSIDTDGTLAIGESRWTITALPDEAPRIQPTGAFTRTLAGEFRLPFTAADDYGVTGGAAVITLDLPRVPRGHGLAAEPEARAAVQVDLPMPFRGDRREINELLIDNLAEHPWAGLPVSVTLSAADALGQTGESAPVELILPARRFLDPLARAIVEQRRDLLWTRANAPRAARILRAVSHRPEDVFSNPSHAQQLRGTVEALEAPGLTANARDEVAGVLWQIAVEIEDGNLADARERLRRAQERLSEAMRQGATPEELRELMDEYREAMREYMRQLAERGPENTLDEPDDGSRERMELTQQDLQAMMDRIEELMREGRMAEAQDLLDQLQQMMENMEMTEGGEGARGEDAGEQAMGDLADALREQQGLSDEAFRSLQDEMNRGAPDGNAPGGVGRDGAQGGEQGTEGEGQDGGNGDLAGRQRALEDELERQRERLPGAGTPEGDASREALERAGRAMDEAADALEDGNISGALDRQAEAMESLREGMRELQEAMRREAQSRQPGDQGRLAGQPGPRDQSDPLGRNPGGSGLTATDDPLTDREDVYRRAQELMEELRRRAGETGRPELERDYLRRLLDLF